MLNLDNVCFEIECETCKFSNSVTVRDLKSERVIICRGCLANIRLIDHERNSEKTERQLNSVLRELDKAFNKKIEIKINL